LYRSVKIKNSPLHIVPYFLRNCATFARYSTLNTPRKTPSSYAERKVLGMKKYEFVLTVCLFLIVGNALAIAAENTGPPGRPPMGPPPEAIAACKGKSEGTAVQFATPRGDTLKGVCKLINGTLAAAPEGGMRGPQGKLPDDMKSGQTTSGQ